MVSLPELSLQPLRHALNSLEKAIQREKDEFIRDSVIQRFEYSFELSWKTLKRYFWLNQKLDESNIKNLFREAGKQGLIQNVEQWFEYLAARNLTSHTYSERVAEQVYQAGVKFHHDASQLLSRLEKILS